MAAPVPTDKVKDQEYSNWLKVTLALYYMKSGLHTFIQSEVDCLHQSLVQKIYGGQTVPLPPCTVCNAHQVRRNKYSGVWTFQKQCTSYCDVWLDELLALHNNPKSEKIYWDNSNVPSWPFKPWECAKVFMPRGQLLSSVGPVGCDAQAMLTLLTNCIHFHHKLSPQGLHLTCTISTIRNKVMHDGEMKLLDADRLTYMQQIIQLLEDPVSLNSIEDCKAAVGNIHKIHNDSLDVFFNLDIEMRGLNSAVNEFRLELGMQEKRSLDTADSLKVEYEQLREQITKRFADVESRMDTIKRDVELAKEQTDAALKQQEEKHQKINTTVTDLSAGLTSQGVRLAGVEENMQSIGTELQELTNILAQKGNNSGRKRKTAGEGIPQYGTSEPPIKKRPDSNDLRQFIVSETPVEQRLESDGLRQIKKSPAACDYTGKELLEAWQSIEEYLLEELAPKDLLTFFEQKSLLSAEECRTMCQLSRSQAAEKLLQSIKAKLPEAFLCLINALDETKQEIIVQGLRRKIEEIHKPRPMTHDQETNATVPDMAYYTLKLELLKDGNTVHDTELKTRGYFDKGHILFDYNMRSQTVKWEPGSVIVYLRPLSKHTKETLAFFCQHGGMKDFVLDLLKKKDIFASLPEGEMTICIQVCCYDKDSESEDADEQYRDVTQMVEKDVFIQDDSFKITDDSQVIRKNLLLQYGYIVEEIEPLQFQDTFVTREIWDISFFEKLKMLERRRARATYFLNEVLDKGNTALAALVHALRNSGNDNVANRLCIVPEISAQFGDEGQIDNNLIEVVQEELATDVQEHMLWSCHLNVAVKKNEDVGLFDKPIVVEEGAKREDKKVKQLSATFTKTEEEPFEVPKGKDTSLGEVDLFDKPIVLEEGAKREDKKVKRLSATFTKTEEEPFEVPKGKDTSLGEETPIKRRPDCDDLRQLKSQTEDKLDTIRRLECIPTAQVEVAKKLLEGKRSIIIKGNLGAGKTTLALHLIDNEMYWDRRVVVYSPNDWKAVDTQLVDIVILDDMLGQFDLDLGRLQEWIAYLPTIQEHVDAGKLQVIITTRADILSKAYSKLGLIKLFSDDLSLTLSSEQLTNSEKMSILNRELQRHQRNITEDEKEKCIANFHGLIGFPQCCSLFAGDSNLFDRGPEFFKSPERLFVENTTKLEATRFLSLAFLFCNGVIYEEYLSQETMPKRSKQLLMELASHLEVSIRKASVTLLRDVYNSYFGLYAVKSISHELSVGSFVAKPCIRFSHAVVCDAVGQVLGDRCPEIVVKYGDSDYLYQRTYTAEVKDTTSQNVFIPVSVYGILAERMVYDVVAKGLVKSVVKHSALKQYQFFMQLKEELHKGNRIRDFFSDEFEFHIHQDLVEGECITFLEHLIQSDEDVGTLMYSKFLEFLACTCKNNSTDCWQCKEKQRLLELALYYHHFEIADKLIAMNGCYTHISLSNAARHGELGRVQTILESLKRMQVFNPICYETKEALCRAYISGHQDVIEFFLKEGITLDSRHVVDVVKRGGMNVLMKVTEHMKCHNNWNPHLDKCGTHRNIFLPPSMYSGKDIPTLFCIALYVAYCNEKFDMAYYLVKNGVDVSMHMLPNVSRFSSEQALSRMIQTLKDTNTWDCNCWDASVALQIAYSTQKYNVCDLLIQVGVSLTMENLPAVIMECKASFASVKKAIQHLKDTDSWDKKCDDASIELEFAYIEQKYDVCDLLVQEGVLLTMKNLPGLCEFQASIQSVKKAIQHLKDSDSWDPKCDDASKGLENAYNRQKYDVCDLLVQEGVSLTMKNLPGLCEFQASIQSVKKTIQHLKDSDSWDPKCDDASKGLENAYNRQKYDVCDLLVQEGVSLTMKNLPDIIFGFEASFQSIKKAIQHLKDIANWNPKCGYASVALENAYYRQKFDVWDLLIQEGVSLTMKNLPGIIFGLEASFQFVNKAMQHLKDSDNWDPKSDDASKALENAYNKQKYDVCDLLVQDGVSLTMKNLPGIIFGFEASFQFVNKAMEQLKESDNWDPKSDDASKALENAYYQQMYYVCDLLVQEGVPLTMKNLCGVILRPLDNVKTAVQQLKDTANWDPKCEYAFHALQDAYRRQKYDVCDLLIQEGVSLAMENLPGLCEFEESFQFVKKAIQQFRDIDIWDPKCDDASKALENAYYRQNYDVCDLLVQEGVPLTMKNLHGVILRPLDYVKTAVQQLKDTANWDPECDDASRALQYAYSKQKYDVCDLMIQEGVSLTMKNLPGLSEFQASVRSVKKAIQHLKDSDNWDPKCDDASKAFENAYNREKYDVCDLLVQEGVSLTMMNLPGIIFGVEASFQSVKKAIHQLKNTDNWDPECDDASKALEYAYSKQKYDMCDLLIQEGVSLTMKILPGLCECQASDQSIKKAIQHLKDSDNWDPKCDDAFKALENAYSRQNYNLCDLLVKEGVSITMKNLPGEILRPLDYVKTAMQQLKDTANWDPKCNYASRALQYAYNKQKYDVCDLLIQEGVSLTMKDLPGLCEFEASVQSVKKAIQHLKDNDNWDAKYDHASKALENAYNLQKYDVCDLLVLEGISLTMKNLPGVIFGSEASFQSVKKAIYLLKDTDSWDPKCEDAFEALENAYNRQKYDVCDILVQEGVTLTMKNLHAVILRPLVYVKTAVQQLKDTANWDPKCVYASKALEYAYSRQKYDVCDLLIQEGVSLTMETLPGLCEFEESFQFVKKAIQQLRNTDIWDSKCDDASKALENAYYRQNYDVCDLLVQEGVSLTMKNLHGVILRPLDYVETAVQRLKDTDNWEPECDDASRALQDAYSKQKYDMCDLLIQEGVSLTMKNLPGLCEFQASVQSVKKAIQHLKDSDNWDPKCDDASKAFENAYNREKYDVCDLLFQEGVSLTMMNLPGIIFGVQASFQSVKKAIQHLKDSDNWDPKCDDASKAFENAYNREKYDMCDLLIQEGVSLTMKNLPGLCEFQASDQSIKKAIQHLKDIGNWDPKCDDAFKALENAYSRQNYNVCDLLVKEGVSITMKNLPGEILRPLDYVKTAMQQLKDTANWDPKCNYASRALQYAYNKQKYDVCDLLIQEGVSLTMKDLPGLCEFEASVQSVKKAIQHLKDNDNWDAKYDHASKALENAYNRQKYDVCDLLVQEGISLTMKNLPGVIFGFKASFQSVKKAIQHLKDTDNWDPKCDSAFKALKYAYYRQNYDVCDLLFQEGVSLKV